MKTTIQQVIDRFIDDYCEKQGWQRIWQNVLVGIADAADPGFMELRKLVIEDHQLPQEALPSAKTVISYFLPFILEIPNSNVGGEAPSEPWGDAYKMTNKMAADLNTHLIQWVLDKGFEAANPDAVMLGEPYLRSSSAASIPAKSKRPSGETERLLQIINDYSFGSNSL